MSELDPHEMYDVLQVSPTAEPEVVAAAYRALAKKYHPDRSTAPDAMNRMARLNIAYQSLRLKLGRNGTADEGLDVPVDRVPSFAGEKIDPSGTLEEVFEVVGQRIAAARQETVDEVVKAGVSRDVAMNLVAQAVRETFQVEPAGNGHAGTRTGDHLGTNSSYDDALEVATAMATAARDGVVDGLVQDGLQRGVAAELADSAFERIKKSRESTHSRKSRLSSEQVDLSGSLERGMDVVIIKAKLARQIVIDEIAQDGVPMRTAEQLVQTAFERLLKGQRK